VTHDSGYSAGKQEAGGLMELAWCRYDGRYDVGLKVQNEIKRSGQYAK